jgi:hypothetical protein
MDGGISRRSMLAGMGSAAAIGSIAANLQGVARAAEEQGESAISLSMLYWNEPKARFDFRKYRDQHLPLLKSIYGDSVERFELRMPVKAEKGMPPPSVTAAVNLWIRDVPAFGTKTKAEGARINEDLAKVTNGHPYVQYDKVIALLGDARRSVQQDAEVFSTYFPAREGATWDARYYVETFLPKLVGIYGPKALARIEVCQAATGQGGTPAAVVASSHLYVRDRRAYMAASGKVFQELGSEGSRYTTIRPYWANMWVAAAG